MASATTRMPKILALVVSFLSVFVTLIAFAESPTHADVTTIALAWICDAGESWIDPQGCVSCHQVRSMIWGHEVAKCKGFDVSTDELAKWQSWSTDVVDFAKPAQKAACGMQATMASNVDTLKTRKFFQADLTVILAIEPLELCRGG